MATPCAHSSRLFAALTFDCSNLLIFCFLDLIYLYSFLVIRSRVHFSALFPFIYPFSIISFSPGHPAPLRHLNLHPASLARSGAACPCFTCTWARAVGCFGLPQFTSPLSFFFYLIHAQLFPR